VVSELQLLGMLRAAGFHAAAESRLRVLVNRAPFLDAVDSARNAAAERNTVDQWLAADHGDALRTFIPSATLTGAGIPRFVVAVPRDADQRVLHAISSELAGNGADAELRNFLDEILTDELAFIDFDPGVGFAALTAATAPVPAIATCAVSAGAGALLALDASIQASNLPTFIRVLRNVSGSITTDFLAADILNEARDMVVYAGNACAVPAVVHGAMNTARDGRIVAFAWRCVQRVGDAPRSAEAFAHEVDSAGTVLGVLGFTHFALVQVDDDVELVPLAAAAGNELVVSLSREYLTRSGVA
jgi:hypothetical protein